MGYRYWMLNPSSQPLFLFGDGLSYSQFKFSKLVFAFSPFFLASHPLPQPLLHLLPPRPGNDRLPDGDQRRPLRWFRCDHRFSHLSGRG